MNPSIVQSLNLGGALAGGSTLAIVLAAFRLLYKALQDERQRIAALGDKYAIEMDRLTSQHAQERTQWQAERDYLNTEIEHLREQISDLYDRIYKNGS